jgi:hypothetical protein
MHDGKIDASVRLGGSGADYWYGIELSQPAILDCVRVSAVDGNGDGKTDAPWNIFKTVVEGSNDGETWEQIMYLGDPYSEYEDYAYWYELGNNYFIEYAFDGESDEDDDMTDAVAFKYYRVWNDDGNDNWGEVEFWATLVEAPETEAPVFFVPTEGTVNLTTVGTIITTGADVAALYDGDVTTGASLGGAGNGYWFGVALDQPAILDVVRVSSVDTNGDGVADAPWNVHHTIVEGSNDGENWVEIMHIGDPYSEYDNYAYWYEQGNNYYTEYAFDGETDEDEDMTDAVAFKYFRIWNKDNCDGYGEIEIWATLVEEEPEYLLGDITGDNSVDILDAVLLFQHSMMPEAYPVSYAGNLDVTKDGNIDINDAVLLFQYSMMPEVYPIA